jgi:hypothetical protein
MFFLLELGGNGFCSDDITPALKHLESNFSKK